MTAEKFAGLTWTDTGVSLVCSSFAGLLCSLNQFLPGGELAHAVPLSGILTHTLFLSLFVIPATWLITVVIMLPFLHFVRKRGWTNPLIYSVLPGFLVLILFVASNFGSSFSRLSVQGKMLIEDSNVVWENFDRLILFNIEPALWACFAGALFWILRVRAV